MVGRRQHDKNIENFVRENASKIARTAEENPNKAKRYRRMYKCKDCNKEYYSFQALGGHRASHRNFKRDSRSSTSKPKLHVCHICGKGFEIGQSLGGHMRKHFKKELKNNKAIVPYHPPHADSFSSSVSSTASNSNGKEVFKYDLNLTPLENEAIINTSTRLSDQRSSEDS